MGELRLFETHGTAVGTCGSPFPPTPVEAVMGYLHSSRLNTDAKRTVFRLLQMEVANENLERLKSRLQQIKSLEQGWDGEDALPANSHIADFVSHLLSHCKPSDLTDWSLFPNVNGTLLLQKEDAGISIGLDEFSYFAESEDGDIGEDKVPLTTEAIVATIKRINLYAAQ
mgnify:CR=1 FL=1